MPHFATFDRRHYRTVPAREGYAAWQPTYEDTVLDAMDLALLDRISSVDWSSIRGVADLGCGTGRTAAWLVGRGVSGIDGVDLTPEMLAGARHRALHRWLIEADVRASGLRSGSFNLVVCSLVYEHLPDLRPLYVEAARLMRSDGTFVLVSFHPFFIMASGMPTHFDGPDTEPIAIETYVHLPSDHFAAGRAAGLTPVEMHEGLVDEGWISAKPNWAPFRDWPISSAWVWRRA